jgi:hypothetical protein
MYTSYEQRLEFLHQFIDGSLAFHKNLPDAKLTKGDGWQLYSAGLSFGMFNPIVIETSRKEAFEEVIAAIAASGKPSDIRLVGPGTVHTNALIEQGYSNRGGTPFMLWSADNSVDDFKLRDGLTVRRLVPSDIDVMNVIFADVYAMTPAMIEDMKGMLLASDDDHAYGLFKDGEMVSLVSAMIYNDTIGIWNMGTPTAHQKNGYGLQLLKYVMKTHKDMGAKNFFLFASPAGKILYDKCGWITLDYLPYFSKVAKQLE